MRCMNNSELCTVTNLLDKWPIIWYRHLPHPVFTHMMFSICIKIISVRKYLHWTLDGYKSTPLRPKAKHMRPYPLSLKFQHEGVPLPLVMDGLKEQTLGKFCRKLVNVHCQLKKTELYSPWQNATEREIKELTKGSGRKILAKGTPRQLWDDFLELEAYICSHISNSAYCLDGKVPKTYMSGETADIS